MQSAWVPKAGALNIEDSVEFREPLAAELPEHDKKVNHFKVASNIIIDRIRTMKTSTNASNAKQSPCTSLLPRVER